MSTAEYRMRRAWLFVFVGLAAMLAVFGWAVFKLAELLKLAVLL